MSPRFPDQVLADIADYVIGYEIAGATTFRAACYCLMDALGCALEALNFPECTKLLGPVIPGSMFPNGARVPGTQFALDPVCAAFNIGTMIRWLDLNDALSMANGGHPSDSLGGILATADWLSRKRRAEGKAPLVIRDVLAALIRVYEVHGVLAEENNFTRLGFDHVILNKVATTAVVTQMLGGKQQEVVNAVSNAWADGATLKVYRDDTGPRKSWAGGDAASRAVWLGLLAIKGERGYPSVLTAKTYGFYDALFEGQPFKTPRRYGQYVIDTIKFKFIAAGLHGQSAAECAFRLHPLVKNRLDDISAITIKCQDALIRSMDKKGPLSNPAARDHCIQYVVAIALIYGKLDASDYEDEVAADPRIDELREKMNVVEEPQYTRDRLNPEKQSNAVAIELRFRDGSSAPKVEVEYPLGHPRRRHDAIPMLEEKFKKHLACRFPEKQQVGIMELCMDQNRFEATPVDEFLDSLVG